MRGNWETAAPDLGARAGIFKKHGITFESVYTQGAGETLQVVISGSADIGVGVGTSAAMAAYVKGAPVRVIGNSTTGTNDLYWYVRTESPIKSLKDATESTTIAYSTNGSSSHNFALAILRLNDSKAKPTSTGAMPATLTQVMTGQIDIGFRFRRSDFNGSRTGGSGSSRAPAKCPEVRTRPSAPRSPTPPDWPRTRS